MLALYQQRVVPEFVVIVRASKQTWSVIVVAIIRIGTKLAYERQRRNDDNLQSVPPDAYLFSVLHVGVGPLQHPKKFFSQSESVGIQISITRLTRCLAGSFSGKKYLSGALLVVDVLEHLVYQFTST